jgi:N-acetylmuramoyl-L-alanine amidase
MSKVIFLDAGHGGINPATGEYVTPGKSYRHPKHKFHQGNLFLEGVFNRQMADKIKSCLNDLGVDVHKVYHDWRDWSLDMRVNTANQLHKTTPGIYISLHANAATEKRAGQARGFEIFTSPGKTRSDIIAEHIYLEVEKAFPGMRMRPDTSDGDHDKEANFRVLTRTNMPAVLIEFGFFDNLQDAIMMNDKMWQNRAAVVISNVLAEWAKK